MSSIQSQSEWWCAIAVGIVLLGGTVCLEKGVDSATTVDRYAEQYAQIVANLGQRDPDSLDYSYGARSISSSKASDLPTLGSLNVEAAELSRAVKQHGQGGHESARDIYLLNQLRAVVARTEQLMGRSMTFDQETEREFGVLTPVTYDRDEASRIQRQLQMLLPGTGSLAERYEAFDREFLIPTALVPVVMAKAVQECRMVTVQHVSLPAGEAVTIEYVRNRPWSAFSRYEGDYRSVIEVNMDFALTVDRALNVACHEAYPGHHTYNSVREQQLVHNKGMAEYRVQPTYSPQSMMSESMATEAIEVAFPSVERLRVERDVLFPIAGLSGRRAARYVQVEDLVDRLHTVEPLIARDYLDGRLEFERAREQLEKCALMAHPEAALKYMNEYRSYVATYTYGRDLVAAIITSRSLGNPRAQWKVYADMIVDPVSGFAIDKDS